MAIRQIALFIFLGKPLVFWSGIITLFSFLFTASVGYSTLHGINFLSFKWHPRLAVMSFTLALLHAIMAFSLYF